MRIAPMLAMLVVVGAVAMEAPAQRERPTADAAPASDQESAERLRSRLSQELERLDAERSRIEAGLRRLEAGDAPAEVRRSLAPPERSSREDRPDDRPGRGRATSELTDADVPRMLTVLRETNPPMYERIATAMERDPERAREFLARAWPRVAELVQLREDDPEEYRHRVNMFRVNREIFLTAGRYVRAEREGADATELTILRDELEALVDQQLSTRLKAQERALGQARERLQEIEGEIDDLTERRQEVIDVRVDEILRRAGERPDRWRPDEKREGEPGERRRERRGPPR